MNSPLTSLPYTDILNGNTALGKNLGTERYSIVVLSNITIYPVKEILEYELRRSGIPASVTVGQYDNIVQESALQSSANAVIVWFELANLTENLPGRALSMPESQVTELIDKTKREISLVIEGLRGAPLVLFNLLSDLTIRPPQGFDQSLRRIVTKVNAHIAGTLQPNMVAVDLDRSISTVSVKRAVDWRTWYSSRLLYTVEFFKQYVSDIAPVFLSLAGKTKKVLVFDCDNTLWKGIIGEDGMDGIRLSPHDKDGEPYHEVQMMARALAERGILLALCSKNNPDDVDEVLNNHPEMVLRNEHFAIKRINWNDKVTNLKEIARTLNLGLDSMVMVDDSEFEASLIEQYLPEVHVLRVPRSISEYPRFFRETLRLFHRGASTSEDARRTEMYKDQTARDAARTRFENLDDYLASLDLKLTISVNDSSQVSRIAQLTQKTNQFNLTTKRYTEKDIATRLESSKWRIYSFSLADRFGDFGLTGVAMLFLESESSAVIDTLLLSCRVLGRNAERSFLDGIVGDLRQQGIKKIYGMFIPTTKNSQVASFYENKGFTIIENGEGSKRYVLDTDKYQSAPPTYIQRRIQNGRTN